MVWCTCEEYSLGTPFDGSDPRVVAVGRGFFDAFSVRQKQGLPCNVSDDTFCSLNILTATYVLHNQTSKTVSEEDDWPEYLMVFDSLL